MTLKYLNRFTDRHGKVRTYFRRNGLIRRIDPQAPDFAAAYEKALKDSETAPEPESTLTYPKGTFGALSHAYESSAGFKQLAETTRREMGYTIKKLTKAHGLRRVTDLSRQDVLTWQDELAERPGTANNMLRVMKRLMSFAVDRGYRDANPLIGVRELKSGEHRAWTKAEHEAFKAKWPLGTMPRRAYALALYTGQRKGDLVRMKIQQRIGGTITLTQSKTAEPLVIQEHRDLTVELAAMKPPGMMMLWKTGGGQFSEGHFGAMMREAIRDALGDDTDCVFHGLRASASAMLADNGATTREIMAVTGHRTLRMVEKYTRKADQKKNAKAAILKLKKRPK